MPLYTEVGLGFIPFGLKMISNYPKKLCLSHHIIEMEIWMRKTKKKEPEGLETSYLI